MPSEDKCWVKGCVSSILSQEDITYFPFPADTDTQKGNRRKLWLEAARRTVAPKNAKLCNFHFITGAPSEAESHPDYIPRLNLLGSPPRYMKEVDELNHELKKNNTGLYADYKQKGKGTHGFKRNLKPEKILGVIEVKEGQRCFLIKWETDLEPDFVTTDEANKKCPELVIKFYEELISWID